MGSAVTDLLGGEEVLGPSIASNLDLARATREGLPTRAAAELANEIGSSGLTHSAMGPLGAVVGSLLASRDVLGARLTVAESDVVVRTATSLTRATEVLGDKNKAVHWLSSPNSALGGEVPIMLLDTSAGEHEIQSLLDRIEYGVYS
jgi:putative toxin-antitoxin system antitoxin component (TIGR02293 family)